MASNSKYESCSVQIKLPDINIQEIQEWSQNFVPEAWLYFDEKNDYGRDKRNHVTVSLGMNESQIQDIQNILKDTAPIQIITEKKIHVWSNDKFDVLYLRVIPNDELSAFQAKLHELADKKFARSKFSPHVSIAFVKPNHASIVLSKASKSQATEISKVNFEVTELEMVTRDGEFIPLDHHRSGD